jgi:hypothetical protein
MSKRKRKQKIDKTREVIEILLKVPSDVTSLKEGAVATEESLVLTEQTLLDANESVAFANKSGRILNGFLAAGLAFSIYSLFKGERDV